MIKHADNRMFPPCYEKRWPRATQAFEREIKAADAYAGAPTPETLTALRNARVTYDAACVKDRCEQLQQEGYSVEIATEPHPPALAKPARGKKIA